MQYRDKHVWGSLSVHVSGTNLGQAETDFLFFTPFENLSYCLNFPPQHVMVLIHSTN